MNVSDVSQTQSVYSAYYSKNATTGEYTLPRTPAARALDSVSISPKLQAIMESAKSGENNFTIGLFGEGSGADVLYIPPAILERMPGFDDSLETEAARTAAGSRFFSGQTLSIEESSLLRTPRVSTDYASQVAHQWSEYKNVLIEFGINFKDSESLLNFIKDKELVDKVNQEFESRL